MNITATFVLVEENVYITSSEIEVEEPCKLNFIALGMLLTDTSKLYKILGNKLIQQAPTKVSLNLVLIDGAYISTEHIILNE